MRSPLLVGFLLAVCPSGSAPGQYAPHIVDHVEVYNAADRFAGWPANNGIWNWGDEIVVGFTLGYHKETDGHTIDRSRPSVPQQARSLDGGMTWTIETPSYATADGREREAVALSGPIDFTSPDFAARFREGRYFYSLDRCRTWQGPLPLPKFGRPGLLARTDYLVEGKHRLTAFIAAEKEGGGEGQPLCIRTVDGGTTWKLVGCIGQQPPASYGYSIMPATVDLPGDAYLSIIRRGGVFDGQRRWWLEAFLSPDDGKSWYMLDQPNIDNAGNPATLLRTSGGRLVMTYGWRRDPFGIRARVSDDQGQSWSSEINLRADGRTWDLGYPRTVQRADGRLVTVYYFNDRRQKERFIAATIWDPNLEIE